MQKLSEIFKALSDETRLAILALLQVADELRVQDVETLLQITQSKASRHLRRLTRLGLLADRRDGVNVHYRIARELDPDARALLTALGQLLRGERTRALRARLVAWQQGRQRRRATDPPAASMREPAAPPPRFRDDLPHHLL